MESQGAVDGHLMDEVAAAEVSDPPVPQQTEDQKYWAAVRENPADFSSWTYLLQLVDHKVPSIPACVQMIIDPAF
jgi:hypothetical protein